MFVSFDETQCHWLWRSELHFGNRFFRLCFDSKWKVDWQQILIYNWKCADLQFDIIKMLPFPYVEQTMANDERWPDKNWLKFNFSLRFIVDFLSLVRPCITEAKAYKKVFVYFDSHRKVYHSAHVRTANAHHERRINVKYALVCVVVAWMFRQQNVGKFDGKTALGNIVSFSDDTHPHNAHIHNFISLFTLRNPNCAVMIQNMSQFLMYCVLCSMCIICHFVSKTNS